MAAEVDQPLLGPDFIEPAYGSVEQDTPAIEHASLTSSDHSTSRPRSFFIISSLTCITVASSISTGLLTVGLPRIASDLQLPNHLLLWPISVYPLASGSCLLFAGSLADLTSSRALNLVGTFLLSLFVLACGLARTGIHLILARAAQGVAVSLCFPTGVAIITATFPRGRWRNVGFSCLGLAQPLGFSVGLVMEGLIEDTPAGWRVGFCACAGATMVVAVTNCLLLPKDGPKEKWSMGRVAKELDWVGVALSSTCLGVLSYVCALLTESLDNMHDVTNIALLSIAMVLIPSFVLWMDRQERLGRPALVPNSLWRNISFVSICLIVLLSWAVVQSMELFLNLFFQKVQHLATIEASIRFMPSIAIGVFLNISMGIFVQHIRADLLVVLSSILAAVSPLLMAIVDPAWSFWSCAFWAVMLGPVSVDVVFTIAHLVVVDVFPPETHALAGAVFNTVAQFGISLGVAVMAIINSLVNKASSYPVKTAPEALMLGYRAVFWTCFAIMLLPCVLGSFGLRKLGRLGLSKH